MMRIALVIVVICGWIPSVHAQEKKSWWNPFAGSASSVEASGPAAEVRESSFFDGSGANKKSGFSMPGLPKMSLWPSGSTDRAKAKAKASQSGSKSAGKTKPNPLSQMGSTTKQWWSATTDFLNPFDDAPKPRGGQGYRPQAEKPKSKGMFGWFSEPEEEEITSVVDFIGQDRPKF